VMGAEYIEVFGRVNPS